jgi:hypothetical protein
VERTGKLERQERTVANSNRAGPGSLGCAAIPGHQASTLERSRLNYKVPYPALSRSITAGSPAETAGPVGLVVREAVADREHHLALEY